MKVEVGGTSFGGMLTDYLLYHLVSMSPLIMNLTSIPLVSGSCRSMTWSIVGRLWVEGHR